MEIPSEDTHCMCTQHAHCVLATHAPQDSPRVEVADFDPTQPLKPDVNPDLNPNKNPVSH